MPKEVFAEEIERFLGTLDGVAAARVFTTPAGEVAKVYVTAEHGADVRAVRRGIVAALVSTYGIPIEPWRIEVTQPRAGIGPGELPRFQILRVEETVAATEMTATVQLAWARGGEDRTSTGRARGGAGSQHRFRALAAATVDAARDALEPAHRKITVQQASLVMFVNRPTALCGISIAMPRGPETSLGIAQAESTSDAMVEAALDAVVKWAMRAGLTATPLPVGDRRARLEAMRQYARSAERVEPPHVGTPPAPSHAAPSEGEWVERHPRTARAPAPTASEEGGEVDGGEVLEEWHEPEAASRSRTRASTATAVDMRVGSVSETVPRANSGRTTPIPDDPDIIRHLRDIRPGQEGVTATVRQEAPRAGSTSTTPNRHSMEDAFYQSLIANRTPVHVRCVDGYEVARAVLRDVGTYSLLLDVQGATELVYKHAILSIRPMMDGSGQA
ncbi:MAG TPA: RNA chaperone Hfq [bacterium]|nr:RNA chaperone Hfq [bacterium]